MFKDKMVTMATPERVCALCKIVSNEANHSINRNDLKQLMEPNYVKNARAYFGSYLDVAEELGLVSIVDGVVKLEVDADVADSTDAIRRHICSALKNYSSGNFYQITKAYFDLGTDVFSGYPNISDPQWARLFLKKYNIEVNADDLRAWRFWFSFLGFGYMHDGGRGMFPLPNAGLFLKNIIKNNNIELNHRYSFNDFIDKLQPDIGIIVNSNDGKLNYGVSCGLRALYDSGYFEFESIMDQQNAWALYPMATHEISSEITYITIKK